MNNKKPYIMSLPKWMRYFNRDGEVTCSKCGKEIKVRDPVVPQIGRRKQSESNSKLYCLKCGDELNLVTDEEVMEVIALVV